MEKFLLILLAVALAVAPLRGALAVPVPAVVEPSGHCDHMQNGAPAVEQSTGQDDAGATRTGHRCGHGCDGDCCDGHCGTCVHASIAVPATQAGTSSPYSGFLPVSASSRFTGCTTHPPFRPPIDRS